MTLALYLGWRVGPTTDAPPAIGNPATRQPHVRLVRLRRVPTSRFNPRRIQNNPAVKS